ncbi:hypothetical protein B0O99DRAFT_626710 [Bisporella sp. PMI_857]|nr:hypothetical protein B0O99DRAFT_626710 [Bisporella sp. PMI_857]
MAAPVPIEEQIVSLNSARKLLLTDSTYASHIIQGILPIIGRDAVLELRRWGADFLSETFASPGVPTSRKEELSLVILPTLRKMIENTQEDSAVVKSLVQVASSIYPLVLRWIINNPYDVPNWEHMTAIKQRILRIWDSATTGVRVCCIKFAQKVVLVQTAGPEADPRRSDPREISLTMVPQNNLVIPPRNLEAEAMGLLDRMLSIFHESISDAIPVDATLNSLSILIRTRPQVSNKILNALLNFNPLKQANSPMTSKLRVMVKSMEKTNRILLMHIIKRDPHNPLTPRIQQHIEKMARSRTEIFEEASRKRGPPEPTNGLDTTKRQKLGVQVAKQPAARLYIPPLTPGPHTIAELFTITTDAALKGFDVSQLPEDLVVKIGVTILQKLDADTLSQAIEGVQNRYNSMKPTPPEEINPATVPLDIEDDDDYEPDFYNVEDNEQIVNKLDAAPPEEPKQTAPDVALGPFTLPPSPALTPEQATQIGEGTVSRVFGVMSTLEEPGKKMKSGMNRLAASAYDRDAWVTIITRLATRAAAGLERTNDGVKAEIGSGPISLSDTIRQSLQAYVLEDFRKRIDIAVAWLCEEWYNDRVQLKLGPNTPLHYEKWVLRLYDGFAQYLDGRDKILTRFLSEIPAVSTELLDRVKLLCRDPALVNLALTSLLYLVMMRPPVREIALDTVEDIWQRYDEAKPIAAKYLNKWRPNFEQRLNKVEGEDKKLNGFANAIIVDATKVAEAATS